MLTPGKELAELTAVRQHALATGVLALDERIADDMLQLLGDFPPDVAIVTITNFARAASKVAAPDLAARQARAGPDARAAARADDALALIEAELSDLKRQLAERLTG